jgi:hypothetical protein
MKNYLKPIGWGIGILVAAGLGFIILLTLVAVLLETNPPVTKEPAWDSPQTRELAKRACFDCHSNETVWPWYDRLPVSSWLAVFDTVRGRRSLNFSEWGTTPRRGERGGEGGGEMSEVIQEGSMPPAIYTMMHPEAVLSAQEKQQLIDGLAKSLK